MGNSVTIKDVAAAAGVSGATVSYVLNGKPAKDRILSTTHTRNWLIVPCDLNQSHRGHDFDVKKFEQKTAKSTKGENVAPQRHRDTENPSTQFRAGKMQCGVYFTHGNTVAKINATLLEGKVEGEEQEYAVPQAEVNLVIRAGVATDIIPPLACPEPVEGFFTPLQEGLRGFKAEYSPPSIPATLDSSVLSSPCLRASVVNLPSSCALRTSVQNSSPSGGMGIDMSKEGALAQALAGLTPEWGRTTWPPGAGTGAVDVFEGGGDPAVCGVLRRSDERRMMGEVPLFYFGI